MANGIFSLPRNAELSLVEYITASIANDWTGVTVVKDFLQAYEVATPVICVRMLSKQNVRTEIGSQLLLPTFTFTIDIFANSDGQRLDLSDSIINYLIPGCEYFDCAKDPSDAKSIIYTPTSPVTRMTLLKFISDVKVLAPMDAQIEDKFRQCITFTMSKYD